MQTIHDLVQFRNEVVGRMELAIQLAGFRAITISRSKVSAFNLKATIDKMEFVYPGLNAVDHSLLRQDFERWGYASTISDLTETFSDCLIMIVQKWQADRLAQGRPSEINATRFAMRGISDQLAELAQYIQIAPQWSTMLQSYNQVRNCITHRGGRVSDRDFNSGNHLAVRWIAVSVSTSEPARNDLSEIMQPMLLEGDASVGMNILLVERKFAVGELVSFSLREILEIVGTFQTLNVVLTAIQEGVRELT